MNKTIQAIGTLLLFSCGGCATGTINDLHPAGGGRIYDVPYSTAYRIALDALEEMQFSIKKDDSSQGEIRAETGRYKNGILLCRGNLLGIFFTQRGISRTRVEIQSIYVVPHDDWACQDKAQQTVSEITKRLLQSSSHSSVQSEPVPMAAVPSETRPAVRPGQVADQPEASTKRTLVRSPFDFRKTTWGMTKEQVKIAETKKLEAEREDRLGYLDDMVGKKVTIVYVFTENKLSRGSYVFDLQHTNQNLFINDYEEIKHLLSEKYGPPNEDDSLWANNLYKDDPQHWGLAVSMGHLRYRSSWETETTRIFLSLGGDNFKISLITQYVGKAWETLERQSQKEKSLSNF